MGVSERALSDSSYEWSGYHKPISIILPTLKFAWLPPPLHHWYAHKPPPTKCSVCDQHVDSDNGENSSEPLLCLRLSRPTQVFISATQGRRNIWIDFVNKGREIPLTKKTIRVCAKHFLPEIMFWELGNVQRWSGKKIGHCTRRNTNFTSPNCKHI